MNLEGKILLVKRLSKTVVPYAVKFTSYQSHKARFHKDKYFPATDAEIQDILELNGIDPSSYSNPLKEKREITPKKAKSSKKKIKEEDKEVKEEQINETVEDNNTTTDEVEN